MTLLPIFCEAVSSGTGKVARETPLILVFTVHEEDLKKEQLIKNSMIPQNQQRSRVFDAEAKTSQTAVVMILSPRLQQP
jgi:hypothetical protein